MALCTDECVTDDKTTHTPAGYNTGSLFVPAATLGDITSPSRDHIYILPDNSLWVLSYDGEGYVSLLSASTATTP